MISLVLALTQTGFTPGATVWIWDVDGKLDRMPTVVEGQTPNIYSIVPDIDLKDGFEGQEGKLEDTFVGRAFGWLKVETAGRYRIRLTCDDGATLNLNGREILNTERGATFVDENTVELQSERIPFDLKFYENTGKFNLKLEWQKPGESDFSLVPASAFLSEAGQTFVVSPGIKRHFFEKDTREPGDGRPVAGIHPSYRLETFRPENFKPQIGGMCFLPDGRLAICTWDQVGAVYIIDGLQNSQVKVKLFAEGLGEPLGIAYLDGDLWVTQKGEITRLRDTDKDGKADQFEAIASGWPASQNYHEFTFNLVPKANKLYLATSVPLRGGWTYYNPGSSQAYPIPDVPGSILEIDKKTGAWSVFANGLRTPNGMGLGVDGEMFVADNQGSWLPCSRINHVRRGGFYGHQLAPGPDSTPKPSEMKPERPADPPVVWLPHGEISNSPSEPVLVKEGPFKGQMFFGDVTYGGIQRMNVEKVNGVYQGAAFRFTQGLEAGVNRLAWGPDKKLYIGGIGSNGNWNHENHRFGLQRLALNGKSAFEMHSISVTPTGFRVQFTEPIARISANNFEITSFRYDSKEFYGGPKLDTERTTPTGIRLTGPNEVELTTPLKKGYVYQFRLLGLKSAKGENPWSYEAWYTLNETMVANSRQAALQRGERERTARVPLRKFTVQKEGVRAGSKTILNDAGIWKSGSNTWGATRKWLVKDRFVGPNVPAHHSIFAQNSPLGRLIPNSIKNQKWNLVPIRNGAVKGAISQVGHNGIHGVGWLELNPLERLFYGTSTTTKLIGTSTVGHGVSHYGPRRQ